MELRDQVCSLELAKRLNKLGVRQESLFVWWAYENPLMRVFKEEDVPDNYWNVDSAKICSKNGVDWTYSAFTVAELGFLLPDNCYSQKDCGTLPIEWICHHTIDENQEDIWIADSEADVRAKLLIYLIENGIINV